MIFGSRFLASQSLQTLMCEKDRRVMLALCVHLFSPHSHYRNWCAQRKGDLFAFDLPIPPVFHLHTSFRYTNSNPLCPHGHYRIWCARSNDGCRMRVSLCAAPLWIWRGPQTTLSYNTCWPGALHESYFLPSVPFVTIFPPHKASIHPSTQNAKISNLFISQTHSPLAPNPLPA